MGGTHNLCPKDFPTPPCVTTMRVIVLTMLVSLCCGEPGRPDGFGQQEGRTTPFSPEGIATITLSSKQVQVVRRSVAAGAVNLPLSEPQDLDQAATTAETVTAQFELRMKSVGMMQPLLMSLLAGFSTAIGAVAVFCMAEAPSNSEMAFTLGLAAGVMLTVSIFDLWLRFSLVYGFGCSTASVAVGAIAFYLLSCMIPDPAGFTGPESLNSTDLAVKENRKKTRAWRLGVIMTVTLTAHNFPEVSVTCPISG